MAKEPPCKSVVDALTQNPLTFLTDISETLIELGGIGFGKLTDLTQQLIEFLDEPSNRCCADCARKFLTRNDARASLQLGVLVCVDCAAGAEIGGGFAAAIRVSIYVSRGNP